MRRSATMQYPRHVFTVPEGAVDALAVHRLRQLVAKLRQVYV